jgi:hypothetical protein
MTDKQKAAAKGIDFKTMNVYQKIGWVQANMTTVKKTGWNNFQSYPYATDADIMNAVRPLLATARLATTVTYEKMVVDGRNTVVDGIFTIINIDNPFIENDREVMHLQGEAADGSSKSGRGDKGIYKAYSGLHKYALMKAFNIPTGDDPEDDRGYKEDGTKPPLKKPPVKRPYKPPPKPTKEIPTVTEVLQYVDDCKTSNGIEKVSKAFAKVKANFSEKDIQVVDDAVILRTNEIEVPKQDADLGF